MVLARLRAGNKAGVNFCGLDVRRLAKGANANSAASRSLCGLLQKKGQLAILLRLGR